MSGITRSRFDATLANTAIDLGNEDLDATLAGTSLDAGKLDALDGKVDGRVSGPQGLDELYDALNRLDAHTAALSSKQELAVWGALQGAAVKPKPISAAQGAALAAAARRQVARDRPSPGKLSSWALDGTAKCENPALSSPSYAGPKVWKCNVFVGEAFYKAGLPFPMSSQRHYEAANGLPAQSRFFQPLASIDDVRPGDVISIQRAEDSGHVEIVTGVERDAAGRVVSIRSAGAHADGSAEGTSTASPLVDSSRNPRRAATVQAGDESYRETYRVLRPMAPPATAAGR